MAILRFSYSFFLKNAISTLKFILFLLFIYLQQEQYIDMELYINVGRTSPDPDSN